MLKAEAKSWIFQGLSNDMIPIVGFKQQPCEGATTAAWDANHLGFMKPVMPRLFKQTTNNNADNA